MLDEDLKEQLREPLAGLGHTIELRVAQSKHAQQAELLELLGGVASVNPTEVIVRVMDEISDAPSFSVYCDGRRTGMSFVGIPGGHEFTSLVVAIMNAAGKGKLPDSTLAQRIAAVRGNATVRTFISLSCENCPDVVQALNQIALLNGKLQHVMIDGAMAQAELSKLNVQGVPAVFVGDNLIHSGRSTLAELLGKLEAVLGRDDAQASSVRELGDFDVAVIGGGPAGVSAAVYAVRKGQRTVLVTERLGGQVQETKGIENLISVVYTEGPQLAAALDKHLRSYPVNVLEHRRVQDVVRTPGSRTTELRLDSGERLTAGAVIVATGAQWRKLGVPGESDYIGRGVAFCPHCDGPYYAGKKVAVVGGGNSGVEAAIDLAGICNEVVLLEFMDQLKADAVLVKKLMSLANVEVILSAKTTEVIGDGNTVVAMGYQDRRTSEHRRIDLNGVFVQIGLSPTSAVVKDLVELNRFGEIVIDSKCRTSAPGIYAAGDVTTVPFKQIVIAMGEGAKAALTAFEDRMRAETSEVPVTVPPRPVTGAGSAQLHDP